MLPVIDFLPASHVQNQLRRRRLAWRLSVACAFLGLALLGTFAQYQVRARLESSRSQLEARAAQMQAQLESDAALYRRVRDLDARANLVTRLRVRVAATRLLADVVANLPPFVSLTEFRTTVETSAPRPEQKSARGKDAPPPPAPPAADLAELEDRDARSTRIVSLQGLAPDDVAVSRFLAALERSGTFDEIRLLYTDRASYREHELRAFAIRLVVRKPRLFDAQPDPPSARTADGEAPAASSAAPRAAAAQSPPAADDRRYAL